MSRICSQSASPGASSVRRSANPIVDLSLFGIRPFRLTALAAFVVGGAFLAAIVFLPLFMVNVVGLSATNSDALNAFHDKFRSHNSPVSVLGDATTGVEAVGAAMFACAGLVLGLKINTIVNLVILACEIAEAIATAVPTFGASLAEIPVFKEIAERIINAIINEVIMAILS